MIVYPEIIEPAKMDYLPPILAGYCLPWFVHGERKNRPQLVPRTALAIGVFKIHVFKIRHFQNIDFQNLRFQNLFFAVFINHYTVEITSFDFLSRLMLTKRIDRCKVDVLVVFIAEMVLAEEDTDYWI